MEDDVTFDKKNLRAKGLKFTKKQKKKEKENEQEFIEQNFFQL